MQTTSRWLILAALLVPGSGWCAPAAVDPHGPAFINRDAEYEQNLRFMAAADQAITPAKVLRWLRGLGDPVKAFSGGTRTEFRPMFNADQDQVEILAAFSYKF